MDLFIHYLTQPYLLTGIVLTLSVTLLGLFGGMVMGILLAAMQLSRFRALALIARGYAIIFRGTPLILQMIFCYNALPLIGIKLGAIEAAGLALALNEGPFIAEFIRGNILAVDRGQTAAGQALGMTPLAIMLHVVSPQAIRTMIPALGNEAVNALKNSSLASVVSVQELTLRSTQLASSTFHFFSIFFASGLMYLALAGLIAIGQIIVEVLLDLDTPTPQERWARLMPWRRADLASPDIASSSGPRPAADMGVASTAHLKLTAPIDRARRSAALMNSRTALTISGLTKSYDSQPVLQALDLEVKLGEVIALLGPSGSGKSTLLRCINRLETWNSGTIKALDQTIGQGADGRALSPLEVANQRVDVGIGMVFQSFNLFGHLTAKANIAGPLRWVQGLSPAAADRRAMELLDRVGLAHLANALPRRLSGGQQQRVAIARALAPNPAMLLLDEPTSALDPELVAEVLDVIRRLAVEDGLTMIISTHQINFARDVADRAIILEGGSIIEDGPADQVLTRPTNPRTAQFLQIISDDAALR